MVPGRAESMLAMGHLLESDTDSMLADGQHGFQACQMMIDVRQMMIDVRVE